MLFRSENPCAEACGQQLYRQTVIRNLPQLQKLDNVAVSSEEMAEAMRRGVELSSPADRLQEEAAPPPARRTVRTPPVTQEDTRGGYQQEEHYQPARKESVQSPSRRVSNQVFPEDAPVYSLSNSIQEQGRWEEDGYEEPPQRRSMCLSTAGDTAPPPPQLQGEEPLQRRT